MTNTPLHQKALELERAVRLPPYSSINTIEAALVSAYNAGVEAAIQSHKERAGSVTILIPYLERLKLPGAP